MRRIAWALALLLVLPVFALRAEAADAKQTKPYVRQILNYYLHYQEEAGPEIGALLDTIGGIDPQQRDAWEKILSDWSYYNRDLEANPHVLPDGLPEDDSLCIVVMGYCLNPDGTIRPELEGRLGVALESARKYPNSYILCTGGPTAGDGRTTEAGQMRLWLVEQGIAWGRIIVEDASLSTTENAMFSQEILQERYPQITALAIVTSDYHVPRSCLMFAAVPAYRACYEGDRPLEVVGSAAYVMDSGITESMFAQAWGIAILAGVEIDSSDPPYLERFPVETVEQAQPVETVAEPERALEVSAEMEPAWETAEVVLLIALGFGAAVTLKEILERRKEK